MNLIAALLYVVSIGNLALAGVVVLRSPKEDVNRLFGVTAFSVAAWTVTNGLFQATDSVAMATLWANISYLSALLVCASLFHFSQIYPDRGEHHRRRLLRLALRFLWLVTLLLCVTPFLGHFVIQSVQLVPDRRIVTNGGLFLLAAFIFATVLGAVHSLLRTMFLTHGRERMQARYVLTGMTVTAVFGLICNLVLPLIGNYSLVWLGPASSLLFVGASVYSIVRERLFDIRIIIHRSLVYGLLVAGIGGVYSGIEYTTAALLEKTSAVGDNPLLAQIGGAILVSLCVGPARKWLERRLDRVVFRRRPGHGRR